MSDRDQGGKFQPGNQAAKGARHGKAHELRRWFRDAVTKEDVEAVAQALVAKAKEGDAKAASILLDRLYGRPRTEPAPVVQVDVGAGTRGIAAAVEAALNSGEFDAVEVAATAESLIRIRQFLSSAELEARFDDAFH